MTNEEIAKKISTICDDCFDTDCAFKHCNDKELYYEIIKACEVKDAQFAEERKALIDKACKWLKRELAEPMPDEMYKKWCDEKLVDFCKIMEE